MRKGFVIALLVVLYGAMVYENLTYRKMPLPYVYGGWIIRLPSRMVKYFSLGYDNVIADTVYIWAIQYFSSAEIDFRTRESNLRKFFEAIWSLDPKYLETYSTAALIANYDFANPRLAIELLMEGYKRNPDAWELLSEAAFYAFKYAKDYQLAHELYLKAYQIKPDPYFLSMAAGMLEKKNLFKISWQYWWKVYKTDKTGYFRKAAERHLYKLKSKMDIDALSKAVREFKRITGRLPLSLEELRTKGLVKEIPLDFYGDPYIYDPETGKIKPRREHLWK
ncbi:MAG: hypothetical protein J7L62_04835 [Candidatus Aminicenantes bacterium]|nr:hypothetical protein [Candidatus Aminicenantes bacterium]